MFVFSFQWKVSSFFIINVGPVLFAAEAYRQKVQERRENPTFEEEEMEITSHTKPLR